MLWAMGALQRIYSWLDVRPNERRLLWLSFAGAFLTLAALTLGRSVREGLYLAYFDVKTLPYIMAATAFLSLPVVGIYTRLIERRSPRRILLGIIAVKVIGLAIIWPIAAQDLFIRVLIVLFYLWTALGILVISSGFWMVTAELFPVRSAKRLFGLISAGGTAGAMLTGLSLSLLTKSIPILSLLPVLIAILLLLALVQLMLPRSAAAPGKVDSASERAKSSENLLLIWRNTHLRVIALIVVTATMASALVDFQFKEAARAVYSDQGALTGFFGAFYGWTGAAALVFQLVISTRLIARAGIGAAMAVLPVVLLFGSAGFALVPGLILITILRGADNSLRKSLFRPVLEYLYVPLEASLRRKTKTFIDSVVDSVADGTGAALIFLWVTILALPSRALSGFVILLAIIFLILSRRMDRQYLSTIVSRLKAGQEGIEDQYAADGIDQRQLLSATFTHIDLGSVFIDREALGIVDVARPGEPEAQKERDLLTFLRSPDDSVVLAAISEIQTWDTDHTEAVIRLLARNSLQDRVVAALADHCDETAGPLSDRLREASTDFVIRRRIPRILARCGGADADDALLEALNADRFEVRYRAAIALASRRRRKLPLSKRDWKYLIWNVVLSEVRRDRPVWELQRLLDKEEMGDEDLVSERVGLRGELSLEHTFRLLSLVLDPEPVRAAFHGIVLDDENLKNFALEYLEQVLPVEIRKRLWLFIGDVSEQQRKKGQRSLDAVVGDLMSTRATLFGGDEGRDALKRLLEERDREQTE